MSSENHPDRPASVGDVLGAAGPCPVVNWRGHPYKVGYPTPDVLAAVELQVAANATAERKVLAEVLDPEDLPDLKTALLGRHHRVGGSLWDAAFNQSAEGTVLILWACVKQHHPEFAVLDAVAMAQDCAEETEAALLLVVPDFF